MYAQCDADGAASVQQAPEYCCVARNSKGVLLSAFDLSLELHGMFVLRSVISLPVLTLLAADGIRDYS